MSEFLPKESISGNPVPNALYMPSAKSPWKKCSVLCPAKTDLRVVVESNEIDAAKFLMCAKIVPNVGVFISIKESFLSDIVELDSSSESYLATLNRDCIARLVKQSDDSFLIALNSCRYCSLKFASEDNCGVESGEREVVGRIKTVVRTFQSAENLEVSQTSILLPTFLGMSSSSASSTSSGTSAREDNLRRVVWCPRVLGKCKLFRKTQFTTMNDALTKLTDEVGLKCRSKIPDYNRKSKALVSRFYDNRIMGVSSVNIIVYEDSVLEDFKTRALEMSRRRHSAEDGSRHAADAADRDDASVFSDSSGFIPTDSAILQFGKKSESSEDEYVLDFRYPLSPLQAFAIAVASYANNMLNPTQPIQKK